MQGESFCYCNYASFNTDLSLIGSLCLDLCPGQKMTIFGPMYFHDGTSYIHRAATALNLVSFDQASFNLKSVLYERNLFHGYPGCYGPPNSKMAIFFVIFGFSSNKKFSIAIFLLQIKNLITISFPTIPNLFRLAGWFASYGPVKVPGSKKIVFTKICAVPFRNVQTLK